MAVRKRRRVRVEQLTIFPRGGKRAGAGRKPKGERALVSHAKRVRVDRHTPVHVTMHVADGLPTLREPRAFACVVASIRDGVRPDWRVVHASVQSTHLHFLVEARDEGAMSRGTRALTIRIAMRLNRVWGRTGAVFADRFHTEPLRSPCQVRNALLYVLNNARHHGLHAVGHCDPYSSGDAFDGWLDAPGARIDSADPWAGTPVGRPESWLLRAGWRKHGLIGLHEVPGARPVRRAAAAGRDVVLGGQSNIAGSAVRPRSPPPGTRLTDRGPN